MVDGFFFLIPHSNDGVVLLGFSLQLQELLFLLEVIP